jgi:hypothetical protein
MHVEIPELRGEITMLCRRQGLILEEQHVMLVERDQDLVALGRRNPCAQIDTGNLCADGR